jgi:hypothetical protein
MFCWIASIAFFGYLPAEAMNQDEPIIKLTPAGNDRPAARSPVRLDEIHKQHTSHHARLPQTTPVKLKVVDEPPPAKKPEAPAAAEKPIRHRAYEGRSQEYNIDEIMRPVSVDPDVIENSWDGEGKKLPPGMVAVICFCVLLCATAIVMLIRRNHDVEGAQKTVKKATIENVETEVRTAQKLVDTIQQTIKRYYRANSVAEKAAFVRHPEITRQLMDAYYAKHPLESKKCDLITSFEFFTIGDQNFWRVLAIQENQKREWLTLEQISDTEVLVDWESHVHYQPLAWSEYAQKRPSAAYDFRISISPTPYYVGEFSDESRWASYRLTADGYDEVMFGYVLRHSEEHAAIEMALMQNAPVLIATLMIPPNCAAKHSVVIQKIVSTSSIRSEPPRTTSN